ncbi:HD-GYP domain-containing protein [Fervidobacterium gondwanense]|uniref:HD-GYP domain-containing protein n=1 Tax=Fervidobacterium gondwanense TaxID=44754 RepID=UPI003A6ED2D0
MYIFIFDFLFILILTFTLMISKLVEARSEETGEHVNRVSEIAKFLAQLSGHSSRDVKLIHGAAALHDIGKVGIPDYILNKPAKLDDKEFAIMKEHTLIGFELLRNSSLKIFQTGAVIALEHHERWDGTGYPYGLEGEQITLESRIVQIADVFEALTQDRCYRPAWPLEKAIEYMNDMKGKQFDPWLIELFNKHLREFVQIVQDKQDEEAN